MRRRNEILSFEAAFCLLAAIASLAFSGGMKFYYLFVAQKEPPNVVIGFFVLVGLVMLAAAISAVIHRRAQPR